jgi:pentapeptide MXKDX repeat protein
MRNLASFLIAVLAMLVVSSTFAQGSMEKNGMAGDSMSKEPAMSPGAKPTPMKKDHKAKSKGHDTMGKDSMSKDSMKPDSMGSKPSSM